jgi:AcrR family transcriptional regulator
LCDDVVGDGDVHTSHAHSIHIDRDLGNGPRVFGRLWFGETKELAAVAGSLMGVFAGGSMALRHQAQSKYFLSVSTVAMKEKIVAAAGAMFADRGIKATTIASIEQAVGLHVGSGGVHRYFATKDDLVRAVLEDQLARGRMSRDTAQAWPLPMPGHVAEFLEVMGVFALKESQQGRQVALIGLREGRSLYERFPDLRDGNFTVAFTSVADRVRAFQQETGSGADIDPEALAFLFMGPAIGLTDERLVTQWARLFAPVFERLMYPHQDGTHEPQPEPASTPSGVTPPEGADRG